MATIGDARKTWPGKESQVRTYAKHRDQKTHIKHEKRDVGSKSRHEPNLDETHHWNNREVGTKDRILH